MNRKALWLSVLCLQLLTAVISPLPVAAQSNATIPPQVQALAQSGEKIIAMRTVTVGTRQLSTYYFTTGLTDDTLGEIFYSPAADAWQRAGIQGIIVMEGATAVADEALLRRVFFTILAGYMVERLPELPTAITADPSLVEQLHRLTDHPVFQIAFIEQQVKSIFKTNEEMDVLALKGMLVAKAPDSVRINAFAEDVKGQLGTLNSVEDAIDATIRTAKYSNDRQVRQLAVEARKLFKDWKRESSAQFDVLGTNVDVFNVLDLISLGMELTYIDQLSLERADLLERLAQGAAQNAPPLTPTLQSAITTVVAEARSASQQRADILLRFVKEKATDLAVKLGTDALLQLWVQTTWDTFGKRTVGHLVAGTASAVLTGFTVANLLYGMDGIYENTVIAQRAASMEEIFMNGALWAKLKRPAQASPYDAAISEAYRTCVLFKNLAAAQVYRSYADSIAASRWAKALADLVTGQQWTEAERFFRKWAGDSELVTEDLIGHPPIIEEAVSLALQTLKRQRIPPTPGGGQTATALVVDVSGSMAASWQGGVKIESAKQAAADVVTMIEQESQAGQGAHQIALVSFTTDASLESPLAADYAGMRDAINRLAPLNNTNLGAGVEIANQALSAAPADVQKIVILLSDGLSNTGLSNAEILSGPVQAAADVGACIYTIGFGNPGEIDEDLLREIAARSGCGTYTYASAPADLERIYIRLRHESTGDIIGEFQGLIAQGETAQIGQVTVPTNQGQLNVTLQWPGSRLELIATDPSGNAVADGQPGVSMAQTARMVNLLVQNPASGIWNFAAVGAEVPEQQLIYNLVASVRAATSTVTTPTTTTGGGSAGLLVALAAAVLVGVPVVVFGAKRRRERPGSVPSGATARLIGPSGELLPVSNGAVLGRDVGCSVRLLDNGVSRQHARLSYARGAWYVQDLGSSNGIFVNGRRVTATALRNGDRIGIGPYVLEFRVGQLVG